MDPLQPYVAFARTLESGSISAAARDIGTSQSAVSKQISSLERNLGIQLFARTTRRLQPTHEALELYEHVRQLLDAVEAVRTTNDQQAPVQGTLRVTMPSAYGRRRILPRLPQFLEMHPQLQVDVLLTDQVVDLVEMGLELGIRIGSLAPSTLTARPLEVLDISLVASPDYLASRGTPDYPSDLPDHACILYERRPGWSRWDFESEDSGRHTVDVTGPICANDPEAMYELVRAGAGIALIPDWLLQDDIASGRLVRLLDDFYPIPQSVNIVYPQTRFLSKRARKFIDFFVEDIRARD